MHIVPDKMLLTKKKNEREWKTQKPNTQFYEVNII